VLNVCNSFLLNSCYLLYSNIFVVRRVFCFSSFCLLCDFHIFSLYCIYLFVCPLLLFTFHWWNLDDFALPRDLLLQMFFFEQLLIFKKLQIFWYFMHTFIYVYIYIHIYKYIYIYIWWVNFWNTAPLFGARGNFVWNIYIYSSQVHYLFQLFTGRTLVDGRGGMVLPWHGFFAVLVLLNFDVVCYFDICIFIVCVAGFEFTCDLNWSYFQY